MLEKNAGRCSYYLLVLIILLLTCPEKLYPKNVETNRYKINISVSENIRIRRIFYINIKMYAKAGFLMNKKYPIKLQFVKIPEGITMNRRVFTRKNVMYDRNKKSARFKIPLKAYKRGYHLLKGKVKFSMSSNDRTVIYKKKFNFKFKVN